MKIFGLYILKPSSLDEMITKAKKDVLRLPNAMIIRLLRRLYPAKKLLTQALAESKL